MSGFLQEPPQLANPYSSDRWLQACLRRIAGPLLDEWQPELTRFGQRVLTDIGEMATDAEAQPPRLVQYDAWGRRIDQIVMARGWRELEQVSAEEGLVALGYERRFGPLSRVLQFAKLYLFHPSSAVYTCPLAMTDGAARLIEVHGDDALRCSVLPRLTTRDPSQFWTSGQWMTERTGGSDVGGTETRARADGPGRFRLFGTKWFTSATTSQIAITLARVEQPDGSVLDGSRGLSAFYLETRDPKGQLLDIEIHRLKDKLGTKALPTAELTLNGTPARMVGSPGQGVKTIASLINITRAYNAVCAAATMRRGLALAQDYAARRTAFGRTLAEQPLHRETLAELETEVQAAVVLVFRLVELLGREECGQATASESAALRLLTPLTKLLTAKQGVAVSSEVLEAFGGAGYVEDSGLPKLLRDSQVLPIWEGTTNVLALDALRAIEKQDALGPFLDDARTRAGRTKHAELQVQASRITDSCDSLLQFAAQVAQRGPEFLETNARRFALRLARAYAASLMVEQTDWCLEHCKEAGDVSMVERWIERL